MNFFGMFAFIIFICLASMADDSYGELVMTYRPLESTKLISLTCESEDDRAALIWNNDLHSSSEPKAFSTIWPKITPKCAIVAPGGCITEWEESNTWSIVNSTHHPMGPVFDSRWEDFEEHPLSSNIYTYYDYLNNVKDSNTIVFSIRGSGDIHVQLCEMRNISTESSLKIVRTRDSFMETRIRTCPTKPSKISLFFRQHIDYEDQDHPEYPINTSDDEWRTFVLRWSTWRTIFRLYDTAEFYAEKDFTIWPVTNVLYSENGFQGRVRFHAYKYFMTTVANTVLSTLEFKHEEENFCIQLLVSLCSACNLIVCIAYKTGKRQIIGNISGYKNESYAKLPTWKTVSFNATLSGNYTDPIRLEIITNCSKSVGRRWAIDSFRKCIPKKAVRSVSSVERSTSNIQCQKLWYGDNSLVNSNDEAVRNILIILAHKPPHVWFITSTAALLSYPVNLNGRIWSTLRFEIKTEKKDWTTPTSIRLDSRYGHHREIPISNLSPETLYTVRVVVTLKGTNWVIIVKSIETNFNTSKDHRIRVAPPTILTVDEVPSKPDLIWLTALPMLMLCALLILVLYRKRQNLSAHLNFLPWVQNSDVTPPSLNETAADVEQIDDYTRLVEIKKFEDYVKKAVANGELRYQFEMLPRGIVRPCIHGSLPNNKSKNRYGNLIAYDETRVILGKGSLGCDSSYINANYIQGYCKEKAYIATQGPKSNTILDFWRMIWQEEVRIICMLVNVVEDGKKMCEQYWPEIGKTVEYGHIVILTLNQSVYANYIYRTFQLTTRCEIRSRTVRHLQYTGWPAEGVPMYFDSIVEYLSELRAIPPGPGPIVVHCTAGTGRTGTIILCDICLRYTAAEGMVDPFVEAKKMYDARPNMLDNVQQYVLAHLMPTQCLFLPSTKLPCSDITPERMEELKKALPCHMKSLVIFSWKDRALRPMESKRLPSPKNLAKLRFPKLMPAEHSVVTLKRYPQHDIYSDYINAVSVDGVRVKKQYIASQLPLPTTLSDCWRLVAENKIELVIILQRPSPEDLTCIDVIPSETRPLIIPVPYIKVEHKSSNYREHFSVDELLLTDSSEDETRTQNVTVITCNNWRLIDNPEPPPPEALVSLWSASERISRAEAPTLVLCRDGVMACGLYLALSFLLEKMIVEQEFDVISAVRAIRRSRTQFVKSKMQFEYLCDAAVKFLDDFDTYANFA